MFFLPHWLPFIVIFFHHRLSANLDFGFFFFIWLHFTLNPSSLFISFMTFSSSFRVFFFFIFFFNCSEVILKSIAPQRCTFLELISKTFHFLFLTEARNEFFTLTPTKWNCSLLNVWENPFYLPSKFLMPTSRRMIQYAFSD